MKLFLNCGECLEKVTDKNKIECLYVKSINENLYKKKCSKGHEKSIILEEHKFEVLFEGGAIALLDSDYKKAIQYFYYSLEYFYEFSIELILTNNKIKYDDYKNLWNSIRINRENLIVAYSFLYLREFKEEPDIIKEYFKDLKEKVIGLEYSPDYKETFAFGEYLFNYMLEGLKFFKLNYRKGLNQFIINKMIRLNELAKEKKMKINSLSHSPILHLPTDDKVFVAKTFKEALSLLNNYKTWLYT